MDALHIAVVGVDDHQPRRFGAEGGGLFQQVGLGAIMGVGGGQGQHIHIPEADGDPLGDEHICPPAGFAEGGGAVGVVAVEAVIPRIADGAVGGADEEAAGPHAVMVDEQDLHGDVFHREGLPPGTPMQEGCSRKVRSLCAARRR